MRFYLFRIFLWEEPEAGPRGSLEVCLLSYAALRSSSFPSQILNLNPFAHLHLDVAVVKLSAQLYFWDRESIEGESPKFNF